MNGNVLMKRMKSWCLRCFELKCFGLRMRARWIELDDFWVGERGKVEIDSLTAHKRK